MKLSELKGEKAVEVIADLIAPIASIAQDQDQLQLFHAQKREGESAREMAVRELTEKIPLLLKTHKADVIAILCAINGTKPEELGIVDIIKGAIELGNDEDFLSLFTFAVGTGSKTPPTGSSVSAEISEPES